MIIILYPEGGDGLPSIPAEVQDIANTLPDTHLVGVSDSEKPIFAAIDRIDKRKDDVRGLWIAGHAGVDKVQLGDISLYVWALVTYVRSMRADWVVFNTCYGDHLARRVRVETGVATLGANVEGGEIEDLDAWRMAAALARSLERNGLDLDAAYKEIDPRGGGQYLYRESLGMPIRQYSDEELNVVEEIHQIKLRLALLEQQVDLKLSSIASDLGDLKEQTATGKTGVSWNAVVVIVVLCLIYFTILAVFIGYASGLF